MAWFGNGLGVELDPAFRRALNKPKPAPSIDPGLTPPPKPAPFDWSTARDEFESSKDQLDRAYAVKKADEFARTHESDGEYFRRTGQDRGAQAYREGVERRKQAEFAEKAANFDWSTAKDEFESSKDQLDREHAFQQRIRERKPASAYASATKPKPAPVVPLDPGLRVTKPTPIVTPYKETPRKPASHYAPTARPKPKPAPSFAIDPGLKPLPATQMSLLEAKEHLSIVPTAEERPVPSYLDPHTHANPHNYDNPVRDKWARIYDAPAWRLQDRTVALLPFNKPNTPDWDDPGKAVNASAKLRKVIDDTKYTEKRAKYVHAKSDKEDAAAKVKQIKDNIEALRDVKALSGLGSTDPNMEDMMSYWEKQLTIAEADLVTKTTAYNLARNQEMTAGRKVKAARNDMDKYLRSGPYTRDTNVTLGAGLAAFVTGLVVYNLVMPLPAKRKTRKYNPLYSVFA